MDQATQIALVRRVLAHLEHRTTDHDEGPTTVDVRDYVDRARLAAFRGLFQRLPIVVGHVSQIPKPGDFVTHDFTGVPLLVVRQDDGSIAARLNICRHRGTRLENAACGTKRAFVCPYHGWSYGRDGKHLGMPHPRGFEGVASRDLVPIGTATAAGLIFVGPEPLDLASYLRPMTAELEGFGLASAHHHAPRTTNEPLSWVLAIDVFLEAYHLKPTHKDSIYGMFFDNLGLVDRVGPHLRNVFPKRSIRELAHAEPESWKLREHGNVLYHLFPNTLVLVMPDYTAVVSMFPDGDDRTHVHVFSLVDDPGKARYWQANNDILYAATDEDFAMGASIQRGLASAVPANRDFVLASYEHALAHFHAGLAKMA